MEISRHGRLLAIAEFTSKGTILLLEDFFLKEEVRSVIGTRPFSQMLSTFPPFLLEIKICTPRVVLHFICTIERFYTMTKIVREKYLF